LPNYWGRRDSQPSPEFAFWRQNPGAKKLGRIFTGPLAKMAAGGYLLVEFESQ
jgi:hypothetical protein